MIFSQLFTPKYKSSDPVTRIAGIERLDKDLSKDKSILHELAFNDNDESVSLAALKKLDSFVLWMKSAESSLSARIKKHAKQVCLTQLEDINIVSETLFLAFVNESANKPLLEQMLFTSSRLLQQDELVLEVLFTLNNTVHTKRFFQEFASSEQQLAIVKEIDDTKTLNRFIKYSKEDAVKAQINTKLAFLANLAEKPNKIKQQVTMINSRLLALKDADDYEYLASQLEQLSREFEGVKSEFSCVDELTSATMTEKYLSLKLDIQQKLATLEDAHQSQLLLKQTTNELSDIQERCASVKIQLDLLFEGASNNDNTDNNFDAEVKILTASLQYASEELKSVNERSKTQAHGAKIKQLATQITNMHASLLQVYDAVAHAQTGNQIELKLASIIEDLKKDKQALLEMSQQELAELSVKIKAQKDAFQQLKTSAKDLLPISTQAKFSKTLANANKLTKQLGQQFKDIESKCENKLKTVNRMIKDGQFKPAMSTFFHAKKMYEGIKEHAPGRIQKAFEQIEQEVNKLQDWQSYIAQPRKPAMLEKALELSNSLFEDPYERTEQVKQLRQEWNSLGLLHTPEDEAQNAAFDTYIEKAFVPCRAFFAELERQREENFKKALGLVEDAKALKTDTPASELISQISALKNEFNKLGDIDKAKLHKVRREFTKIFKPLSSLISAEQNLYAEQKQSLINQASKLNDETQDDELLPEAIDKAKALQQKWKQIGFAGKAADNQLWHSFRKINDALFERYHQNINNKKSALQQQFNDVDKEINGIVAKIKAAQTIADLQFYEPEHDAVFTKSEELDEDTKKRIKQKIRKMEDAYSASVKQLNKVRDESALSNLFAFLHEYTDKELPDQFELLLSRYKTWVRGEVASIKTLDDLDRNALTQVTAILLDIAYNDLPVGDKAIRKDLQLKMMASKLQGDAVFDTESVLAKWVSLGPVKANEKDSLLAMQKMFIG